jgi:DNA-entry nuclease
MKRVYFTLAVIIIAFAVVAYMNIVPPYSESDNGENEQVSLEYFDYTKIPEYDGKKPYVVVNDNKPYFDEKSYTTNSYEEYGKLDNKGRCTYAMASIGKDLMPTEERGSIGSVKPTGWQISKYDFIDGNYLYNRCHLIGYQLTGENANKGNLITGTRYMNVQGMLPFEDMVADYVKETDNHVLYRVTPIFLDNEMLARGVLMEAVSVEDDGDGVCFNVFCYNVQPKVRIYYTNGENYSEEENNEAIDENASYILNTSSHKFHRVDCTAVKDIVSGNRKGFNGTREELILDGYSPCGSCKP